MRPVTLAIEGLRSFRSGQPPIDFTGRDHIAIIGDTGAGKSSILEAITFALYGRTTFSGKGHQELMNTASTTLRVVLTFDMGPARWEVSRVLRRAGDGKVGGARAELQRHGPDGEVVEAYSGAREVNDKVVEILGLDVEAFLRTVVLPQGQFARLLVDDDQGLRTGVLRQIWRTDELEAAGRLAADAASEVGPILGRAQGMLALEPADPMARRAELRSLASSTLAEANAAESRRAAVEAAVEGLEAHTGLVELTGRIEATLGAWHGAAAVTECERLATVAAGLDGVLAAAATEDQQAREALAAVPSDGDGLDLRALGAAETVLGRIPGLVRAAGEASAAVGAAHREQAGAQQALHAAAAAVATCAAAVAEADEQRRQLDQAVGSAREALEAQRSALARARLAHEQLAVARAEQGERAERLAAAQAVAAAAAEAATHAGAARDAAVAEAAAARRADAAATAAHGLHAGDDCPVCARGLPASWSAPVADELERAEKALRAATDEADVAGPASHQAAAALAVAADAATRAAVAVEAQQVAAVAAVTALVAHLATPPDLDGSDESLLAGGTAAHQAALDRLAAHDTATQAQRDQLLAAGNSKGGAENRLAGAVQAIARTEQQQAAARATLVGELAKLPSELAALTAAGSDGDANPEPVEAAVAAARQQLAARRAVLDERAEQRAALRAVIDQVGDRRRQVAEQRRTEVGIPLDALWTAGAEHARQVGRAEERLDLAASPFPATVPPVAELAPTLRALQAATAAVLRRTADVAAAAQRARAEAHAELASVATALGLHGAGDEPARVTAAARAASDEARLAARRAGEDAAAFEARAERVAALQQATEQLEAAHLAVSDLAVALKDGAFPKWLTLRRSRRLLVHASRLLGEMSAGRYGFADLADDSSPWAIFDHDSGQPRSPASLSGGEKFVASLALALGMVEMVGRSGGVVESLFLDEGFGALDRANLDSAVEALATVAAGGRMVAVISHVRAVAEQVEHVLSVTREPGGTRVRWLEGAERTALVEGDLGTGAAAGLLD